MSIIKAYPTNLTKIVGRIRFDNDPSSLFIDKNYLTVFGTGYQKFSPNPPPTSGNPGGPITIQPVVTDKLAAPSLSLIPPIYQRPFTWVHVYDITKKEAPRQIKNYTMAGFYSGARKSEQTGFVYILSNQNCASSDSNIPWYNFGVEQKNMTLSQIFYYPVPQYNDVTFTNLLSFNLRNPNSAEENAISFLTLSSWIIYMSENFLYLTSN